MKRNTFTLCEKEIWILKAIYLSYPKFTKPDNIFKPLWMPGVANKRQTGFNMIINSKQKYVVWTDKQTNGLILILKRRFWTIQWDL